ncbi:CPBP family intramembrane glutamic endopeptidase [Pontibacter sp. MBLB2868]|uniref:CPBP family intramembrane glutamic endopeptidase n=1 Tax=Pontibacter sp. MBLB2868 TaxID=3451555 RepID=UPI003F74D9D4
MIGILLELAISWILLRIIENESILALGFLPILKRFRQFLNGFLVTCILCISLQLLESTLKSSEWIINSDANTNLILSSFFWDLKSVVTEELLFRGALLYILIKRIGSSKAILLSAMAFGIYHWFSFGIFGNIVPMVVVFIGTGLMGYAWGLTFSKTNSIAMPIGFHLGWNFTFNTIFSKGPLGEGLLILSNDKVISSWFSLLGLLVVPLLLLVFVKFLNQSSQIDKV